MAIGLGDLGNKKKERNYSETSTLLHQEGAPQESTLYQTVLEEESRRQVRPWEAISEIKNSTRTTLALYALTETKAKMEGLENLRRHYNGQFLHHKSNLKYLQPDTSAPLSALPRRSSWPLIKMISRLFKNLIFPLKSHRTIKK